MKIFTKSTRLMVFTCFLFFCFCDISKGIQMNEIHRLVGDNECFYKGGYGIIAQDVYIKKGDTNNNLYSASEVLFNGGAKETEQIIYIKNPTAPVPFCISIENFELPKEGILLLFRKDYVYILNYASDQYCKYRR